MDAEKKIDYDEEIQKLKDKKAKSRNIFDKALYEEQIKALKEKKKKEEPEKEKEVIHQSDAPSVADHVDKKFTRGDIVNSGDTFVSFI